MVEKDISVKISPVMKSFSLSVSNQSSSLAIAKNQSFACVVISHKPLNCTKITSLIALFLTGDELGARTHTSKKDRTD